jgi:nucleoid-associated protein YgaU
MSISANSRYANSKVAAVDKDGQSVNVIVPGQQWATTITYVSHLLADRDRLDLLANQYYGDPTQWWQIANANPELSPDWSKLVPGTIVRIPFS